MLVGTPKTFNLVLLPLSQYLSLAHLFLLHWLPCYSSYISGTTLFHPFICVIFSAWTILPQDIYMAYSLTTLKSFLKWLRLSKEFPNHLICQQTTCCLVPALFSSIALNTPKSCTFFYVFVYCLSLPLGCKFHQTGIICSLCIFST